MKEQICYAHDRNWSHFLCTTAFICRDFMWGIMILFSFFTTDRATSNWIQLILRSLPGLQDRQEIIDFVRWLAAETNYEAKQTGSATQEENGKLPNKINKIIFAIMINTYCCFVVLFFLLLTLHGFKFLKSKPHWLKLNFQLPVILNL